MYNDLEAFILDIAPPFVAVSKDPGPLNFDTEPLPSAAHPIKVYAGHSDRTIWSKPEVNHAARAWHDLGHLILRAPFTMEGEMRVAQWQLDSLDYFEGHPLHQLFKRIMWAEVVGQTQHFYVYGKFPDNQRAFIDAYLKVGGLCGSF